VGSQQKDTFTFYLLLRNELIIRKTGGESELLIQANLKTPDKNTKYGKESLFLYQISKREERK
jgi:hypothetical protein